MFQTDWRGKASAASVREDNGLETRLNATVSRKKSPKTSSTKGKGKGGPSRSPNQFGSCDRLKRRAMAKKINQKEGGVRLRSVWIGPGRRDVFQDFASSSEKEERDDGDWTGRGGTRPQVS